MNIILSKLQTENFYLNHGISALGLEQWFVGLNVYFNYTIYLVIERNYYSDGSVGRGMFKKQNPHLLVINTEIFTD